jgi:L-lactate dehydrogenase complex protein LldF
MKVTSASFKANAKRALGDEALRQATARTAQTLYSRRKAAALAPDFEALRDYCARVKAHTLEHLDLYLERLVAAVEARGGEVHFAADAAEARALVMELCAREGARRVVKAKSMLAEELELNEALEAAGVTVVETDLGEYILQLSHDVPSHIIAPVIHKSRAQIAELFHARLGTPPDADAPTLAAAAQAALREAFLSADMGITGANFAVAETGSVVLVENEGNIRLTTSLPRVHVAVVGLEKLIPRLRDLPAFLRVLSRSATGQKASSYVSLVTGPRRAGEREGPERFHLLLVDNGRSAVLADEALRDALRCIRCGACLNACPVYRQVGGHAYGWVYPGPIGAILDPGLLGLEQTRELPQASSLCGACSEVCPVKIPIDALLLEQRRRAVARGLTATGERLGVGAFAFVASRPALWQTTTALGRTFSSLVAEEGYLKGAWLPVLRAWLEERDFPQPAKRSFRERWRRGEV